MREVVGSTSEEKRLITAIQQKIGAYANGVIGCQTLSDIAIAVDASCWPLNIELYSQPTIIAKDIDPFNPMGPLAKNCISGSFSDGYQPCSVLIQNGKVICWSSCHYQQGKPESVLYKTKDGRVQIKRVLHVSEDLPLSDVVWAVGGMGLIDLYDPMAEGFTGAFSDVLRKTNHTVLGYKGGMLYGVYFKSVTAQQINVLCKGKFGFEMAIMLDGGHIAAINGEVNKINVNQRQLYAVRFI